MEKTAELSGLIRRLLDSQRFAVLATQSGGQPYCNLVAFAEADNLKSLIFVTGRDTRKYSNTLTNNSVALLIDSRTNEVHDFNRAVAVTALGMIAEVTAENKVHLSKIYLSKHSRLKSFLNNPANALMKVAVSNYIVATFDGVRRLSAGEF